MALLHFPRIGDRVLLERDWTFPLYAERRNTTLFKAIGRLWNAGRGMHKYALQKIYVSPENPCVSAWGAVSNHPVTVPVTLPAQTVLRIDRLYFRHGLKGYDSVTFVLYYSPERRLNTGIRFWAKADDINIDGQWHDGPPEKPVRDGKNKKLHETPIEQREDSPAFGLPIPNEFNDIIRRWQG